MIFYVVNGGGNLGEDITKEAAVFAVVVIVESSSCRTLSKAPNPGQIIKIQ